MQIPAGRTAHAEARALLTWAVRASEEGLGEVRSGGGGGGNHRPFRKLICAAILLEFTGNES